MLVFCSADGHKGAPAAAVAMLRSATKVYPSPLERIHDLEEGGSLLWVLRPTALEQDNVVVQPRKVGSVRSGQRVALWNAQPAPLRYKLDELWRCGAVRTVVGE